MKHLLVSTAISTVLLTFAPASYAALILSPGSSPVPIPVAGNDFNVQMADLGYSQMITGSQLSVDQAGSVTFTYIAAESGYTNSFNLSSGASMTEHNEAFKFDGYNSLTINVTAGEILNFNFTSLGIGALSPVDNFTDKNLQGLGIFTKGSGSSHQQLILGYDDQWITPDDDNHDDMMIRVDFSPVPVPAALWLFGSGLLGLVGIARRKKA
jgi:hypothetical protein